VLAELSVPELVKEQAQKAALVKQAKAEVDLANAQKGEADAGIVRAAANRKRWESEYERVLELYKNKVVEKQILDETLHQYESAKAASLEATAKLAKAKADIDVAGARVEVAQAEADRLQALAEYRHIRAPFDGVITRRNVHTGHFLQPNASGSPGVLFIVARTDKLRIIADIPEAEAGYLGDRPTAKIHSPIIADVGLEAKVTRTSWTLDTKSRTLRVEIHHDGKGSKLRPGMFVTVTISIDLGERMTLPQSALIPQSDPPSCWRVVDGKAVRTALKLGVRDGQNVEVLKMQTANSAWENITGQESVVLSGLGAVSEGKEVRGDTK
jgi:RND family efflux transporter MFP subunit